MKRNVLFQHFRKLGVGFVSEFDLPEKGIGLSSLLTFRIFLTDMDRLGQTVRDTEAYGT